MKTCPVTRLRASVSAVLLSLAIAVPNLSAAARSSSEAVLDPTETTHLLYMREEEKLARDVYDYFYPLWNTTLFDNISESEQQHFDAIGDLLASYRLADPATPDLPGVFVNTELQGLYDQLIAAGSESLLAALRVGALIEETDMIDLATAIVDTDEPDIQRVYENLLQGSRNHLRAYVSAIEAQGVPYEAQVLSQDQVDAIIDSPMERGTRAR